MADRCACSPAMRRRRAQASRTWTESIAEERAAGLFELSGYAGFASNVVEIKCRALEFLIKAHDDGKIVCGYGAAAKGNTFLNYCGIGPELVEVVADRSPHKQNTLVAGQPHSRRLARRHAGAAPRLRPNPALEPEGRDCRAA